MDVYPTEFITHEAPLLVVSGLGSSEDYSEIPPYPLLENGPLVSSELPPVTTEPAPQLLNYFLRSDASGVWAGHPERGVKGSPAVFRIRAVGRHYRLPSRKANPPASGVADPAAADGSSAARPLHSPISPLSPDSPLYPDGVMSHIFLRKHQSVLPAVFVSFYKLYTDTTDVAVQNQKDNEIIVAINSSKKHFLSSSTGTLTSSSSVGSDELRSSGHRTKFVAVIISERSILSSAQVDDRLSFIKRNANLTTNITFFFLPSNSSPPELQQFVNSLLTTLNPGVLEYYRELSKHARRKRNKGSIPLPTVPTSRALSSQAWILRYEFKLAIFAEFRQEMDVAYRNYETAYEKLLTEVFETTSSWNERWKEARLLADILTIRMIRCQLWSDQYTAAKRRWGHHVIKMKEILDRKGRGTDTYGFAAWMSRWNKCLAEMLQLANLPPFVVSPTQPRSPVPTYELMEQEPPAMFAHPEKSISVSDRITADDYLHHQGFYFLKAAEWMAERKSRSKRISTDDATDTHDTYLCPPPRAEMSTDHDGLQIALLLSAQAEFSTRQQKRNAGSIAFQLAELKMRKAVQNPELWSDALKELRTIATEYRKEGWWTILEAVLWKMVECGRRGGDGGSAVVAELELMCANAFRERKGWRYDIGRCLEGVDTRVKPTMIVRAEDIVNMLSVSYTFEYPQAHVGEPIASQVVITCHSQPSSAPVVFSELKVTYEGSLKTVLLRHDPAITGSPSTESPQRIDLKGIVREQPHSPDEPPPSPTSSKSYIVADSDLSFHPGQTKIFEFSTILREAGDAKAACATLVLVNDGFELDYIVMLDEDKETLGSVHPLPDRKPQTTLNGGHGVWWIEDRDGKLKKKPIRAAEPESLKILPRPPKIDVVTKGLEKAIYVDEIAKIGLEIINGEDEDADVGVDVMIMGWPEEDLPSIKWISEDGTELPETASLHPVGELKPSARITHTFSFVSSSVPADCAIEIKLRYHLLSDPQTPIEKTVVADMPIINPFAPTFDFSPRVHPERWPDYFTLDKDLFGNADEEEAGQKTIGIIHRWCLTASVLGVAEEGLIIEEWDLLIDNVTPGSECRVEHGTKVIARDLDPSATTKLPFILTIQKRTLEDRSPTDIDTSLTLRWRRNANSPITSTSLSVPRLYTPLREPRVLAVASPFEDVPDVISLSYTIENPTAYFLTFNILMEMNDAFAFSGPKQSSLQLLPMSRVSMTYRLYPYVRGVWIRPGLRVVDRYFNKSLKCSPGDDGVDVDKMGLMVWVPGDEENEEE